MFGKSVTAIFTIILAIIIGTMGANASGKLAGSDTPTTKPVASAQTGQGNGTNQTSASPMVLTGSGFTYQGKLSSGGNAANGNFDINFSLWDAASGGAQVGSTVAMANQAVSNGLFTVNLDFGPSAFQGSARWLEMSVRPAGLGAYTTLTPRQPLTATPYAMGLMPGAVVNGALAGPMLSASNSSTGSGVQGSSINGVGGYFTSTSPIYPGLLGYNLGTGNGIEGSSVGGIGIRGSTNDTAHAGVYGVNTTGGPGVQGEGTTGNGVWGITSNSTSAGVFGTNSGGGIGVRGTSATGVGGYFTSTSYIALRGDTASNANAAIYGVNSGTGPAVMGQQSNGGSAVYGLATSGYGVSGISTSNIGVSGSSTSGYGVSGYSSNSTGVYATSGSASTADSGMHAVDTGANGNGVIGEANNGTGAYGVWGKSTNGYGVYGSSTNGYGISGSSSNGTGIYGYSNGGGSAAAGVNGTSYSADGTGVIGEADNGFDAYGVWGKSTSGYAVYGLSTGGNGVYGVSTNNVGVAGYSSGDAGVEGETNSNFNTDAGVHGFAVSNNGSGVIGESTYGSGGYGVWGKSNFGYAGWFSGNVHVNGTLSKSAGSFKIDDPIDPANKYLSHSFVESPDMMNIYNGEATLDARGEATITMPAWFQALNQDFRYQLTSVGAPGPNLYIAQKITGNTFKIAGGTQGMEVSWQVTGIRHDPYAEQHRIPVEENKPANEKGFYLNPNVYGQPATKAMENSRGVAPAKNSRPTTPTGKNAAPANNTPTGK